MAVPSSGSSGSIPLLGGQIPKPKAPCMAGAGIRISASGLLRVMMRGPILLLPLDSRSHGFWLWEKQHRKTVSDSKRILHHVKQSPTL